MICFPPWQALSLPKLIIVGWWRYTLIPPWCEAIVKTKIFLRVELKHLAYEHGFSMPQYAEYEAGANITFAKLTKVLKALGVTPEEFFKERN